MSGFAATSGKFEVFAPGDDTHVMFNDNNDYDSIITSNGGKVFINSSTFINNTILIKCEFASTE